MEEKKLNWKKTTVVLLAMLLSCQLAACNKEENIQNGAVSGTESTTGTSSNETSVTGNVSNEAVANSGEDKVPEEQENESWIEFTGEGYKISYPNTWEKQELSDNNFSVSPKDLEDDDYAENVMVVTQDLSETGEDLDALKENVLEEFDSVEGFEKVSCEETTLGGEKAYKLIMKCSTGDVEFQSLQVFTVVGNKGYIFGFSGDNKGFEQYKEDAEEMLDTFQFMEETEESVELPK